MMGRGKKGEVTVSDGVVNGIDVNVWNVDRNGVICAFPPLRRNRYGAAKSGAVYPHHRIDGGKNAGSCPHHPSGVGRTDEVCHPLLNGIGVVDASFRCFSVSLSLPQPPSVASDDSFLYHGPSHDPNHERTHSSSVSPSPPRQPLQPAVSVPTSQPHLSPLELLGPLGPVP